MACDDQQCFTPAPPLTMPPSHLVLGNDQLHTVCIVSVGNGVLEQADGADQLGRLPGELLALDRLLEVGRVTNEGVCLDSLIAGADADELAIIVGDDLVDGLVEHVGTSVDGRQTSEALGQLT